MDDQPVGAAEGRLLGQDLDQARIGGSDVIGQDHHPRPRQSRLHLGDERRALQLGPHALGDFRRDSRARA